MRLHAAARIPVVRGGRDRYLHEVAADMVDRLQRRGAAVSGLEGDDEDEQSGRHWSGA
jgi:hypothetical protein